MEPMTDEEYAIAEAKNQAWQDKWDRRFLNLAKEVSTWSHDPSTKVGAVIVDQEGRIVSTGYNGFPRGVEDSPERYEDRDLKLAITVHAELNAITFARRNLEGCTIYVYPFLACSVCAGPIVNSGIQRCVAPECPPDKADRWAASFAITDLIFQEGMVAVTIIENLC